MRRLFSIFLILGIALGATAQANTSQQKFANWLERKVWPMAKKEGVSRTTFDTAFRGVALNLKIPGLKYPGANTGSQRQAEFRAPARYFSANNLNAATSIGRKLAGRHQSALAAIERKTGVPGHFLLSIWGRESGFGNVPIKHNAFEILGTRAFFSEGSYLTSELIAALKIAEEGHVPTATMKSSWAGALGQPQMMPRSFLAYGADGTGDRRADIWGSEVDTLASIANFLKVHEWVPGRDWGFEVVVPASVSCTLEGTDQGRRISDWEKLGIKRINGKAFPSSERRKEGYLLMPAGRYGPAFIVTPNFYVIKRYNHSDLYALYVGHSADRIKYNSAPFRAKWTATDKMLRSDIARIQKALERKGHDVGGADGLPGFKTRRSIGRWQEKAGLPATCFPSQAVKRGLGG